MQQKSDEDFISLNGLATEFGLNYRRAMALRDHGILKPDVSTPYVALFKVSRVEELRKAVAEYGLARAIKANAKK